VDHATRTNRRAWDEASSKYAREYAATLAIAADGSSLLDTERELLRDALQRSPRVVHLQSGNGTDDVALIQAGARSVVGIDFSEVAVRTAQRRAIDLDVPCHYIVAVLPGAPLATGTADLVYTGKGALIWMSDLSRWARDVARLLKPSGHLFVHEEHPATPLWSWDADEPRVRADRSYFATSHVDAVFPAGGATRWQWSLGALVTAVADAGLQIVHLAEYPEPFWRPAGVAAAAWTGRLPNSFALLARRPERHDTTR
jgi:SAM-dependent methyltransferase